MPGRFDVIDAQRRYYARGATLCLKFRRRQLQLLLKMIRDNEATILQAVKADLNRPEMESLLGELGFLYAEIRFAIKNLTSWARPRRVPTPLLAFRGRSTVHPSPKGVVLIIAPWNYPVQLVLGPLVGAIAAGNCAILKPSELAPHTSRCLADLISKTFEPQYICLLEGGVELTQELLSRRFDHIFFTGSAQVGKKIALRAAETLTPVTLELGGKSPCIVDKTADITASARRIAWGKFFNAGQTCIAPDYLVVHDEVYDEFMSALQEELKRGYSELSGDFTSIINQRHYERLTRYLTGSEIVHGGRTDPRNLRIEPTVISGIWLDHPIMKEEIFGPILPVLRFSTRDDLTRIILSNPDPLAFYVFSRDQALIDWALGTFAFGGACVNDTLVHYINPHLPFGGVGSSGYGSSHGEYGFNTFSHFKSILHKGLFPDFSFRYRPYSGSLALVRRLLDWI